jgi:Right handed beta helix region
MTKTAFLLMLIVGVLASMPAQAQRVFVSGHGLDTNPCTATEPCRTFQQAYNTAPVNGEIDVLDPASYGGLTIIHGISIRAHGFGGITHTASSAAITISVTTSDPVTLNGLVVDGAGTGHYGIYIASGPSVQILNSVVRRFTYGIFDSTSTNGTKLLIEDTIASDNTATGIVINPSGSNAKATLNRITVNNNVAGIAVARSNGTMLANSVISNNSFVGLYSEGGITWLAKSIISGNGTGVAVMGGIVNSYGDNYINTPVSGGTLTPVSMQ